MRTLRAGSVVFLPMLLGGPALADIINPTSQTRFIETTVSYFDGEVLDSDNDYDEKLDFDPFSSTVTSTTPVFFIASQSDAMQNTTIQPETIFGSGTADAHATGSGSYNSDGAAESFFSVTFTLFDSNYYALNGLVEQASGDLGGGFSGIELLGPDGTVASVVVADNDSQGIAVSGTLPAGEYTLLAYANTSVQADFATPDSTGHGSYNFELIIPEPASLALLATGLLLGLRRQ